VKEPVKQPKSRARIINKTYKGSRIGSLLTFCPSIIRKEPAEMEHINWYPGHMKKTRELIQENLKAVDIVIEVVDARIPVSSRNPIIDELIKNKRRIMALNKSDLSDSRANDVWVEHFKKQGYDVLPMNCMSGYGVPQLLKLLNAIQEEKNVARSGKSRCG
jgi:ribosome biogenesis GTPase A